MCEEEKVLGDGNVVVQDEKWNSVWAIIKNLSKFDSGKSVPYNISLFLFVVN